MRRTAGIKSLGVVSECKVSVAEKLNDLKKRNKKKTGGGNEKEISE